MKTLIGLGRVVACAMAVIGFAAEGFAQTRVVTTLSDAYPTPVEGSLRAVLAACEDGDVVTFDATLAGGTLKIALNGVRDNVIPIPKAVKIDGAGVITIDGSRPVSGGDSGSRVFEILETANGTTEICGIHFQNSQGRGWSSGNISYQSSCIHALAPLYLHDCDFKSCVYSTSPNEANGRDSASDVPTGSTIRSVADLRIEDCQFENCWSAGGIQNGGIFTAGENLTVKRCTFKKVSGGSYSGVFWLDKRMVNGLIEDCVAEDCNAYRGGFIYDMQVAGSKTIVRNCRVSGGQVNDFGGGVHTDCAGFLVLDSCSFDHCTAGSCGGGLCLRGSVSARIINCTIVDCACGSHGGAIDLRSSNVYFVNTTATGGLVLNNGDKTSSGGFYAGSTIRLLNSVVAYCYYVNGLSDGLLKMQAADGSSGANPRTNSYYRDNYTDGTTVLFADYTTRTSACYTRDKTTDDKFFLSPVKIPQSAKDKAGYVSVPIMKGSALCATGYPVRISPDYSYIGYTDDAGDTWKTFCGTATDDAVLLAKDGAGNPFYRGVPPIGSATYVPLAGMQLIFR